VHSHCHRRRCRRHHRPASAAVPSALWAQRRSPGRGPAPRCADCGTWPAGAAGGLACPDHAARRRTGETRTQQVRYREQSEAHAPSGAQPASPPPGRVGKRVPRTGRTRPATLRYQGANNTDRLAYGVRRNGPVEGPHDGVKKPLHLRSTPRKRRPFPHHVGDHTDTVGGAQPPSRSTRVIPDQPTGFLRARGAAKEQPRQA
jgi:hypothetical protein